MNSRDQTGCTPLMLAAARGRADICRLLVEEGADRALVDAQGRDALQLARLNGHASLASLLGVQSDPIPVTAPLPASVASFSIAPDDDHPVSVDAWEAEAEPGPAPEADETLSRLTAAVQASISAHRPIDTDQSWTDIALDLPIPRRRSIRSAEAQRFLARFLPILVDGLRGGAVDARRLEAFVANPDGELDEQAQRMSDVARLVLEDAGVVMDELAGWWVSGEPVGSVAAEDVADAEELLETLAWSEDGMSRFSRDLQSMKPMSAERETRVWREMRTAIGKLAAWLARDGTAHDELLAEIERQAGSAGGSGLIGEEELDEQRRAELVRARKGVVEAIGDVRCRLAAGDLAEGQAAEAISVLHRQFRPSAELIERMCAQRTPEASDAKFVETELTVLRKSREAITRSHLRLVVWLARRYQNRGLELPDLIQEGVLGLLKAIDKFELDRSVKFSTYAAWWIRQGVSRAVADQGRMIRIPVHLQEWLRKVRIATLRLESDGRDGADAGALAGELGISALQVRKLLSVPEDPIAFEQIEGDEPGGVEAVADPASARSLATVIRTSLAETLRSALLELPPREERVLRMRNGMGLDEEMTLEEIGEPLQVTRERIRQIEAKALRRLAHPVRAKAIAPFLEA